MRLHKNDCYLDVIPYQAEFGEFYLPHGYAEEMRGKELPEQADYFTVEETCIISSYSYGECDSTRKSSRTLPAWESNEILGIVELDGLVVGLWLGEKPLFFGHQICTYSASEDDGTGSTDREDYIAIVLNPEQELEVAAALILQKHQKAFKELAK